MKHGYSLQAMESDSGLKYKRNNTLKVGLRRWYAATPIWTKDIRKDKCDADGFKNGCNTRRRPGHWSEETEKQVLAALKTCSSTKEALENLGLSTNGTNYERVKVLKEWEKLAENRGWKHQNESEKQANAHLPQGLSWSEFERRGAERGLARTNVEFAKALRHEETARIRALRYSVGETVSVDFLVGSRAAPTPFSGKVSQVISTHLYQVTFDDGEVRLLRRDQMRRLQQQPSTAQTAGQHLHPDCSTCCICSASFVDMPPATEVCALPCKHSFCALCIERWFHESDQKSCPVCRRVYSGLRHCFKTAAGLVDTFQLVQQGTELVAGACSSGSRDQVDSEVCGDCGGEGCHDDSLLVCDGCNTTMHLPCVQLELQAKPAGRWFCCRSDSCTIKAKAHEWQSKAKRQRQYKAPIAQHLGEIRATKPKGVYPLQWLQRECTSRNLSAGGHIRDLCNRLARWELKFSNVDSCSLGRSKPGNAKETESEDSSVSQSTVIGMRVRKFFPRFGYYSGRVLSLCGTDRCKIMYDDGDVEELDTSEALKLVDSKHGHNGTKHATSSTCVMKPENVMQIAKSRKAYTRMDSRDSAVARGAFPKSWTRKIPV